MRHLIQSRPILLSSLVALSFGAMSCEQSNSKPQEVETVETSPIERLARAAVTARASQEQEIATVVTPKTEIETAADLEANKMKLQAMAALLSGASSIKSNSKDEDQKPDVVPAPQAGPELSTKRSAPKVTRRAAPVSARPIDERAAKGLAHTLSDASFSEVMSGWRGIKTCVKSITSRGLGGSGAIKVSFKINADGSVKSSKVANATNLIAERVGNCVTRQARKIQFPAYAGAEIVSKEAKFVF